MKKLLCGMFIFLILFSFSSFAQAQSDTKGIYVGLVGGYVIPGDLDGEINMLTVPYHLDYDLSFKNGYLVGAKVGWLTLFTKRIMAVEFEYNHIENKMDSWENFLGNDVDADGKIKIDLFMFNLIARYPTGRFHPYIGAGAGFAHVKITDAVLSYMGSTGGPVTGGTDDVFACQAMAGLDFDITKNIIVGMAYKYLFLGNISFGGDGIGMWGEGSGEADYNAHNIMLSLSYMF